MPSIWTSSPRAGRSLSFLRSQCRRNHADARPFAVGDHVVLRPTFDRTASPALRGPLKEEKRIETHRGIIHHDDIIGKRVRELVRTKPLKSGRDGFDYRIQEPTLDEYVRFSRRLVTPIYPADANLIVSLLDLHPDVYDAEDTGTEKLEVLEAGTGHGGLTLYLSRALHTANPPRPRISTDEDTEKHDTAVQEWKPRRKAVLHTIDISHQFSEHARKTIAAYRNGQYLHNIDFHTGSVGDWVKSALTERNDEPFLSHAFLDLPSTDEHVEAVTKALKVDGTLIVFNPSITQITECALKIKQDDIPLTLDKTIELGVNAGSGGREWDVRPVKPRAQKVQPAPEPAAEKGEDVEASGEETSRDQEQEEQLERAQTEPAEPTSEEKWAMVCRPKVGERIVGGGFLGVFKKQRRV